MTCHLTSQLQRLLINKLRIIWYFFEELVILHKKGSFDNPVVNNYCWVEIKLISIICLPHRQLSSSSSSCTTKYRFRMISRTLKFETGWKSLQRTKTIYFLKVAFSSVAPVGGQWWENFVPAGWKTETASRFLVDLRGSLIAWHGLGWWRGEDC